MGWPRAGTLPGVNVSALAFGLLAGAAMAVEPCSSIRFLPLLPVLDLPGEKAVVAFGDFTGDGLPDVLVLDPTGHTAHIEVQQPDGGFLAGAALAVYASAFSIDVADLDGDGRLEAVLFRGDGPQLIRVKANGTLEPGPAPSGVPGLPSTNLTAFADIDRDGRKELVAVTGGALVAYRLNGSSAFESRTVTTLATQVLGLAEGDFNGDGNPDVLLIGPEDYPTFRLLSPLLLGDGHGGFAAGPSFNFPEMDTFSVADFNDDGRSDFLYAGIATSASTHYATSGILFGDASSGLSLEGAVYPGFSPFAFEIVGDFDGDRHVDLVEANGSGAEIHRGLGTGAFAAASIITWKGGWERYQGLDMDGDGRPDIVTTSGARLLVARNICASTLADVVVPAVVSVAGMNGSHYETELTLDSPGEQITLELRYVPSFGGGGGTASVTIPARGQLVLKPALAALAALGIPIPATGDRGGILSIRGGAPVVTARVTTPTATGHAGVALGGVPLGIGFSGETIVGWLRETGGDRSSLALVNLGGEAEGPITLRPIVIATDADSPGAFTLPDVTLAPGQVVQIGRVLNLAGGARGGFARVTRVAGKAPFFAYGVVNDERTNDGSYVAGIETLRLSASKTTVPSVVETGRYSTDLVLTNVTEQARTVSFRWVSNVLTTFDETARFSLTVPPNGQLFVPDLVDSLRRQGVAGIGARGPVYAGALFAEANGGSSGGLFIGARVSAAKPEGRYGVFYRAVPEEETGTFIGSVFGARQDASVRTNLAIVNTGEVPADFQIDVADPATGLGVGTERQVSLDPGHWTQIDSVLTALGTGIQRGNVFITSYTRGVRFLAYGITNDGAMPGVATDDGSFLPMLVWQ